MDVHRIQNNQDNYFRAVIFCIIALFILSGSLVLWGKSNKPKNNPKPASNTQAQHKAKPASIAKPVAKSASKHNAQSAPKPASKPAVKSAAKPAPKSASKSASGTSKKAATKQKAASQKTPPTPSSANKSKIPSHLTVSLNYPDLKPKVLFQILSETYHVQFEGADTVTGNLTIISKQPVDINGMLGLLNQSLAKQSKQARLEGGIIRINPVKDLIDKTIMFKYADPKEVIKTLTTRFMPHPGEKPQEKSNQLTSIQLHPSLRAIIVQGPKQVINEVEQYIKDQQLDTLPPNKIPTPTGTATIVRKEIPLKYASPDEVIKYLTPLYLANPKIPAIQQPNKVSLIIKHPKLPRIIVMGPENVVSQIENVVKKELDLAPPELPMQRDYIALDYMDADEFASILANDETLKGKFTAVAAPNNILIISSRDKSIFPKIEKIKKTFDVDRMEIRYIQISNAQVKTTKGATGIADLIKAIYPQKVTTVTPAALERFRRQKLTAPTTISERSLAKTRNALAAAGINEPGLAEKISRSLSIVPVSELTIVPDPDRNGLLIRTWSRNFPAIMQLISELDKPRKQVFIDVFITEVNLDKTTELGVDFTRRFGNDTLQQTFLGTTQRPTGLNQPAGLSYQLISDNITAYIRALEASNKLDVISRPQIVTKDNTRAQIELGRDVPTVSQTRLSIEGAISSSVIYKKVATTMQVTPHIHSDGYVTLQIQQTIDDISAETFQISKNFNPQVLIRRNASTELRVKDGQTVCLGGFVGDSIVHNETKVPLLGDIPLLGNLFKYSSDKRVKKELIIFITPHIIATPTEMLRMTNHQRRMTNINERQNQYDDIVKPQRHLRKPPYQDPQPQQP